MLGKLLEQAAEGRQLDTGATVAELLRQYMLVAQLDRSTRRPYEGYIRRTILPALGPMEVRKVRGPVLDMLYARLHRWQNSAQPGPMLQAGDTTVATAGSDSSRPYWHDRVPRSARRVRPARPDRNDRQVR